MILKGNILKLTIPFFWAVQSIWLLSFKSIETFIAAIILLLKKEFNLHGAGTKW